MKNPYTIVKSTDDIPTMRPLGPQAKEQQPDTKA